MQTISSSLKLPPGVRFRPTDEDLIVYYLLNKLNSRPLPADVIGEVELYNYNPWDLPNKAPCEDDEWYFFSPRDRKYPNGARPNRTAASGYWKATGTDKPILSSTRARIGVKKALVFYIGKPPNGIKTDWIMTEYRIPDTLIPPQRSRTSMRLDDWVLCRIKQKGNNMSKKFSDVPYSPSKNMVGGDNQRNMKEEEQEQEQQQVLNYIDKTSDMTICPNCFLSTDCHLLANLLATQEDSPPTISTVTTTTSQSQSSNCTATNNCDEPNVHGFKITKESCDDHDQVISSHNSDISTSNMNSQGKQPGDDGNGYEYEQQEYRYVSRTAPHYLINNNEINLLINNNHMLAANVSNCFFNQDVSQGVDHEFKHNLSNPIMNLLELDISTFAEEFLQK